MGSGVAITFDDNDVDGWCAVHAILKKFNWKATFFISDFQSLDDDKIKKLSALKEYGHEIGGHGCNHLNALSYVRSNGIASYMENEIIPLKKAMADKGFDIASFAFPFGARNKKIDSAMFKEFKALRGTTWVEHHTLVKRVKALVRRLRGRWFYYKNKPLVFGLGIDGTYGVNTDYIRSCLEYAKRKNRIIIFYAHNPVEKISGDYQVEYQRLIEICEYANANNMDFMLMSDFKR